MSPSYYAMFGSACVHKLTCVCKNIVHHVNGNQFDNRPENLIAVLNEKLTEQEIRLFISKPYERK